MWIAPKNHKIVGAHLEAARRKAGMTQVQLARLLKKPQSFVSAYESGQRRVDLLELMSIANALGADARKLSASILDALPVERAKPGR